MANPEPRQIGGQWGVAALAAVAALFLVFLIYQSGQPVWAVLALGLFGLGFFIYLSNVAFAYRYLFPGLAGMAIFVAFPLLFTAQIGFTNYSSTNLLSFERATSYFLDQLAPSEGTIFTYTLHSYGSEFRLSLVHEHDEMVEQDFA